MSRTDRAARLDAAEAAEAHARGRIAALHSRPLGGCLEPKHRSPEIAAAFRAGHAEETAAIAQAAA